MARTFTIAMKASLALIMLLTFTACHPSKDGEVAGKDSLNPEIQKLVTQADDMQEEINRAVLAKDIADRDGLSLQKLMYRLKVDLIRMDQHPNETDVVKDLFRTLKEIKGIYIVKRDRSRIDDFVGAVGEVMAKAAQKNSVQVEGLTWTMFSTEFSNEVAPFLSWNSEWKTDWTQKDTSYIAISGFKKKAWLLTPGFNLENVLEPAFRIKHTVIINRNNNNPLEPFDREAILRTVFKVLVSTDYNGGDPESAHWRRLDISPLPISTDFNFVFSPEVSLAKYRAPKVTLAFVFDMAPEMGQHYITWQIQRFDLLGRGETPKLHLYPGPLLELKVTDSTLSPFEQFEVVPGVPWEYTNKPHSYAKIATASGKPTENWLLTPRVQIRDQVDLKLNIKETVNTPDFPNFRIMISKDYVGGDPKQATWEPIQRKVEDGAANTWTDLVQSDLDMSPYANQDITIGFQFISDGSATRRTWEIESLQFIGKGAKIGIGSGSAQ